MENGAGGGAGHNAFSSLVKLQQRVRTAASWYSSALSFWVLKLLKLSNILSGRQARVREKTNELRNDGRTSRRRRKDSAADDKRARARGHRVVSSITDGDLF